MLIFVRRMPVIAAIAALFLVTGCNKKNRCGEKIDMSGEVGDASEGINGAWGHMCYFAAKGIGPEGETIHPNDPDARPYLLTSVADYYNFLVDLKGGQARMVKFAAIVGVRDVEYPASTTIDYFWDEERGRWDIENACTTANCTGRYCSAKPGTRYIALAQMFGFGQNGFVDTICQADLTGTMERLAEFIVSQ